MERFLGLLLPSVWIAQTGINDMAKIIRGLGPLVTGKNLLVQTKVKLLRS